MGVTYIMTCPQCNADLPDSTAFCPRCGSSIRPASFSYLPAGAPAWPTNVSQMPFYKAGSSAQAAQEEANLSAAKIVPRPRRGVRGILAVIALLILVPLVGVGATLGILWANGQFPATITQASVHVSIPKQQTPAAASSPTATSGQLPTPTSFQTISSTSSSALGIAMKYPGNWVETPTTQPTQYGLIAADFHPQQQLGIDVTVKRIPSKSLTGATIQEVNQANIDSFGTDKSVTNLHTIASPNAQLTVGGVQWTEQDAAFTDTNQLPYHFTVLSVLHNQYYYSVTFYAPNDNYNEAMQKYFQPMLNSLQFQS